MKRLLVSTFMSLIFTWVAWALPARAQFTAKPACFDGQDNDHDNKTDYDPRPGMGDPGCDSTNDTSEADLNFSPKVRARLAVIFDTSGSMIWNVCTTNESGEGYTGGDGSRECPGSDVACCHTPPGAPSQCMNGNMPVQTKCDSTTCGNGVADDARLYKVKQGVHDAVAAYGELEYALYRFHADAKPWLGCPDNGAGIGQFGGWEGALDAGSCKPSDLLVKFGPENSDLILQWMDQRDNWSGAGDPPLGMDFELRGTGFTPLGASLGQVKSDIVALRATDTAGTCRPYRVVLVTDGQETCGGDPKAAAAALKAEGVLVSVIGFASSSGTFQQAMNDIAAAGGTGQAFLVDNPASLSAALAAIAQETVLVETCNGLDDDCDGLKDNGFDLGPCNNGQKGTCFREGTFICAGEFSTTCNAPMVTPDSEAAHGCNGLDDDCDGLIDDGLTCTGCGQEICNGLDDDCNGTADDGTDMPGVGDECQIAIGECKTGSYACEGGKLVCKNFVGPSPEICDGKDNDCNTVIDQLTRACYDAASGCVDTDASAGGVKYVCKGRCRPGAQTCTAATQPSFGACSGQVGPGTEVCNGIDDDCDGDIDEGLGNIGTPCSIGKGICRSSGKLVCRSDGMGVECDALVITGSEEVCNGFDDDCDGLVDNLPEPPPAPIGDACGTCGGHFECRNGLVCSGGLATAEVCNGKDDDCNLLIDDGDLPDVGTSCVPGTPPQFVVQGECKAGSRVCSAGGLACVNFSGPQPEVCNGKDDDCDGNVDDMAACPSPTDACYMAQCVSPCGTSEFPCPFGQYCKQIPEGRFCLASKCVGQVCPTGQVCDPETGACKDPCAGVMCPTGAECRAGRCVDCFQLGCPMSQTCVAGANGVGTCQVDRCAGVTCGEQEYCLNGTCTDVVCKACAQGQYCDEGSCVNACAANLCVGTTCATGFACDPQLGRCVADPCLHATCALGQECAITCQGRAACRELTGKTVLATGGGGVKCAVAVGGRGTGGWLLALALLALRRKRRRR